MCSIQKDVLRNFTKFTGKHLCQSLFFNKVAGLRPATLLKKRLWHNFFTEHLWTTASVIHTYLTDLIKNDLSRCFFSENAKPAAVTPICKNEAMNNKISYRPISLLNALSKIYDSSQLTNPTH